MTTQQLIEQIRLKKSFLCIGLDVDLDKIPTQSIGAFEQALLQKLKAKGSSILDSIRKDKSISDMTDKALRETLDQLVKSYA